MLNLSFCTPVTFGNQPTSLSQSFLEFADDYFFLGGQKAIVKFDKTEGASLGVELVDAACSVKETAFKIISYFTLILPALLLLAKYILRECIHHFHLIVPQLPEIAGQPLSNLIEFVPHLPEPTAENVEIAVDDRAAGHRVNKTLGCQFLRQYPTAPDRHDRFIEGGIVFKDEEILQKSHWIKEKVITQGDYKITARLSQNNKWVLPQIAIDGCSAAAMAMLILDHGKEINLHTIFNRHKNESEKMQDDLKSAGLTSDLITVQMKSRRKQNPLSWESQAINEMSSLLKKNGSAWVGVWTGIGNHSIILDAIDEDGARIRDPFHAWEITITNEAFFKCVFAEVRIIQIRV